MAESFTIFVDPAFDYSTRQEIGHNVIRYIQERTKEGRGIGNRPFSGPDGNNKYSDHYTSSLEFKLAGKTGERTVNLTLTGDMLDSIEILDSSVPGRIEIGFEEGFEDDKARWMREKGYDFLGITDSELAPIVSEFESESGKSFGDVLRELLEQDEDGA